MCCNIQPYKDLLGNLAPVDDRETVFVALQDVDSHLVLRRVCIRRSASQSMSNHLTTWYFLGLVRFEWENSLGLSGLLPIVFVVAKPPMTPSWSVNGCKELSINEIRGLNSKCTRLDVVLVF